jgi:hypothetical protein
MKLVPRNTEVSGSKAGKMASFGIEGRRCEPDLLDELAGASCFLSMLSSGYEIIFAGVRLPSFKEMESVLFYSIASLIATHN